MGNVGWSLEVVRGREVGRRFGLSGPETVLGNALAGASGIDLAGQEGDGPRRMAARHASIAARGPDLALRDLDSPGGTFLNRQRVLPGQALPLKAGDTIQVGSVQLRVVESANGRPAAPAVTLAVNPAAPRTPLTLAVGATCWTWDDVLKVAAQRWGDLRDELTSGRVDAWLRSIGRPDLVVSRARGVDPDDHLDAWLGVLPATIPARPELDVHPARLTIRVTPGGGKVIRTVQVANVGHRLLKVRASFEPGPVTWARVVDPAPGASRTVVDAFDLPIEVVIPDALPAPLSATLRIEGNGGERRVAIVVEARTAPGVAVAPAGPSPTTGPGLGERLAGVTARGRVLGMGLGGVLLRFAVGVAAGTLGEDGMKPADASTPALAGVAIAFGLAGGLAGALAAFRRRAPREASFGMASGAIAGAGLAAVVVAACRGIEPILGGWSASPMAAAGLWGLIGLALAGVSLILFPPRETSKEAAR